jgi:hypothetical protein
MRDLLDLESLRVILSVKGASSTLDLRESFSFDSGNIGKLLLIRNYSLVLGSAGRGRSSK